mmetsp:Transcript_12326/g.18472  ORF Transcript_12326/g.18472 Transcript_12326/m.18472 type:complete len:440 (+) Transcript_12326:201-1520(+)
MNRIETREMTNPMIPLLKRGPSQGSTISSISQNCADFGSLGDDFDEGKMSLPSARTSKQLKSKISSKNVCNDDLNISPNERRRGLNISVPFCDLNNVSLSFSTKSDSELPQNGKNCFELKPNEVRVVEDSTWNIEVERVAVLVSKGLSDGYYPTLAEGCSSGAYYMRGPRGKLCAVFKPMDEEAGGLNTPHSESTVSFKVGVHTGDGALRECLAYLIDQGYAGVPPTSIAQMNLNGVIKTGSLQVYVDHECTSEDIGPSLFSKSDVQKIAALDIRLLNQDRHIGNILVKNVNGLKKLIPIDHGYCIPHYSSIGEADFSWMLWPQVKEPINDDLAKHIKNIDSESEANELSLSLPLLPQECIITLRIGTLLLKLGLENELSLFQIGSMIVRKDFNLPSDLEKVVERVAKELDEEVVWFTDRFVKRLETPLRELVLGASSP